MSDRSVRLPIRIELQRSRLWVHRWLVDGKHVAYINSFDEEPCYGSERIDIAPSTLSALLDVAINVHSIDPWQSPAWSDPKAPIRREESGLSADSKPRHYGEQEVLPDGGQTTVYECDVCSFESSEIGHAQVCPECRIGGVTRGGPDAAPDGGTRQLDDPLGWPPHRRADPLDWPPTRGE